MKRKYPVIDIDRTGKNLKRIMLLKGLTVKDIQRFLELGTPQSIYHWFDGRNLPTIDHLYALSDIFALPVDALLIGNRKCECKFECQCKCKCQDCMRKRVLIYCEKIREWKAG